MDLNALAMSSSAAAAARPGLEDPTRAFYEALGRASYSEATGALKTWQTLVANSPIAWVAQTLARFRESEKMYTSYEFLRKNLFKRDSLNLVYNTISEDFQRAARDCLSSPLPATINGELFADLFRQTCTLINVRQKLISTYRLLAGAPSSEHDYRLMVVSLEVLFDSNRSSFPHPCLSILRNGFKLETSILICLFKAQLAIGEYDFKDSTALLFKCRGYLDSWRSRCLVADNPKYRVPNNFTWLSELHGMLVAKTTLYFYNIILAHETELGNDDLRSQFARSDFDYYDAIRSYHRRTDALNISLLYHASSEKTEPFRKDGYVVPSHSYQPPTGLKQFQTIFSFPAAQTPTDHKINIVSIILDKDEDISITRDTPFKFLDTKAHATYYVGRLDPRVYLVVIYNDRPASKESMITEFFSSLCDTLRSTKMYEKLNRFSS